MTEPAIKRIQEELEAMLNDPPPCCTLLPMGDDIFRWNVEIQGPPGTPLEGGTYTLLVTFPSSYPISPPIFKFETRIFHPNITPSGNFFLSSQWAPGTSMAKVFLSIIALLSVPNPSYHPVSSWGLGNWEAALMLRDDPDKYNRVVRAMVETQRGGRTTRRVPSVKRRRVGLGSPSRIMASRAGEIEERGEDVAEGINNGDERGVGEDDEREGGAAGEGVVEDVVDDGVINEEGGAVEQSVGRLKSKMEVVHALQGDHRQFETVEKENGRLEDRLRQVEEENRALQDKLAALERLRQVEEQNKALQDKLAALERLKQVEEENRALQDKLAALETKNAQVAEKKPITKTESNSRSDCCKEACASLRALVESFKERAQMLLHSREQEELVRQNDLRASVGQAHKEDKGEHLAQEGDDGEALAREGAGEENFAQEGAGGEHLAHGGDGEQDLEQEENGADDVAENGVGGEDDAQAQEGEEDLAQEGVE